MANLIHLFLLNNRLQDKGDIWLNIDRIVSVIGHEEYEVSEITYCEGNELCTIIAKGDPYKLADRIEAVNKRCLTR